MNANPESRALCSFTVHGVPAPQGSKVAVGHTKTGRVIMRESSKKVGPWREAVATAALKQLLAMGDGLDGPLSVSVSFFLPRPKRAFRRDVPQEDIMPTTYPDIDKLVRSTLDGMVKGGLLADDARVVDLLALKRYANPAPEGAFIMVSRAGV